MAHESINIMLVEDHQLVRQGMAMLINRQDDMNVVYDCDSVEDAKQFLHDSAPSVNVAVIDISLNGISGFELIKWSHISHPELAVLVVSMHEEDVYAAKAIKTGAKGYLMKHEACDKAINAIRAVNAGKLVVSEAIRARIARNQHSDKDWVISNLTACEYEIFQLLAKGKSTSDIAQLNHRSVKTIEAHRANIRKKLGLADGNALIRYAIKMQNDMAEV
jgi:DNA-binding NarL/FixJ family response regulator